jgi:hypothetical protein
VDTPRADLEADVVQSLAEPIEHVLHQRVKHPHPGPVRFVFLDKLFVRVVGLVAIVSRLIGENEMQADIPVSNVDFAIQFATQHAGGEKDYARLHVQILLARGNEFLDFCGRVVLELEKNVMRKSWRGHIGNLMFAISREIGKTVI